MLNILILLIIIKTAEQQDINKDLFQQYLNDEKEEKTFIKQELIKINNNLKIIDNDFINMNKIFNDNFDLIINYNLNLIKKMIKEKESGLIHFPYSEFIKTLIVSIFLRDFLYFYDEYSYRINYKIKIIFNDFSKLNLNIKPLSYIERQNIHIIDIDDYKLPQYLTFEYFLFQLEEKVSKSFSISIRQIRQIILKNNEDDIDNYYILSFYEEILKMKRHILLNGRIIDYNKKEAGNDDEAVEKTEAEKEEEYIKELVIEYLINFSTDIKKLYKYHIISLPEESSQEDKARFNSLELLLKEYNGDIEKLYYLEYQIKQISGVEITQNFKNILNESFLHISYKEDIELYSFSFSLFINQII